MIWQTCLSISIVSLLAVLLYVLITGSEKKAQRKISALNAIMASVFVAVFIALIPTFVELLTGESAYLLKLVMFDVLQTIQVFTVNVGADFVIENINGPSEVINSVYSTYLTILFFIAPFLTFGFIISLFQNTLTYVYYLLNYRKDVYIFSELNEQSAILAKDLHAKHLNAKIIFAGVDEEEEQCPTELIPQMEKIGALIFKQEILSIDFSRHSRHTEITFFMIGADESENVIRSLSILSVFKERANTNLYVYSSDEEGEMMLANAEKGVVKVRRINEIRALIYRYLYEDGIELFQSAVAYEKDREKKIHAVVAGMGKYGTEIAKALPWFCQMDGYEVTVDIFDADGSAEDRFAALCPELMSESYNGVMIPGESHYTIRIHGGMELNTMSFAQTYKNLETPTFVFVSLGDDKANIIGAARIRMLSEQMGVNPVIRTVVYNPDKNEAVKGITNYRGQSYRIQPVGDLETSCSEAVLMSSELERLALERHLKWGKEEEFWQYEYNYRSSMASAIHMKQRILLGIPGAGKAEEELTEEERDTIEHLEHRRWNTYMRSEGYIFSGSKEKSSRNDLAKMHHDLVDFDSLTEEEKRKDSSVGTR